MGTVIDIDIPEPVALRVDPERTLLVLVDLENEFCHPDGRLFLGPEAQDAVRGSAEAVARARAEGWRRVWIRSLRAPDAMEFTAFGRGPHLVEGSWAVEYTDPLNVAEGETVIEKRCHDCFTHTGLDRWLASEGIVGPQWHVLVAGVALNVCVDLAVTGFSVRDHRVGLLADCVAPATGPGAATTLWRFGQRAYSYNVTVTRLALVTSTGGEDDTAP